MPRVITDYIHVWKPSDFPGGVIDYPHIEKELLRLIVAFRIRPWAGLSGPYMRAATQAPSITSSNVQFPHPGGEHCPDAVGVKGWEPGNHRRKFLKASGFRIEA